MTGLPQLAQAIPSEAEVLLPAGIALKVTSVLPKSADGLTIVTLEDDDEVSQSSTGLSSL
eukprot:COSAG04_NODE_151_length_22485_cov_15.968552_8_plen_60_part_00